MFSPTTEVREKYGEQHSFFRPDTVFTTGQWYEEQQAGNKEISTGVSWLPAMALKEGRGATVGLLCASN